MIRLLRFASLVGLVLPGCGGSSSTSTDATRTEYDEVARSVASTTATAGGGGDTGAIRDAVSISAGTTPLGFSAGASGHLTGAVGSLSFDFDVTCKDASGSTQPVCIAGTTNSAAVDVSWAGSLAVGDFSAMVDHSSSWTLSGLTTDTATLNGTGRFTYDSQFTGAIASTYHFDFEATYDAVAIATSTQATIGGSISYDITARHTLTTNGNTSERDLDIAATLSFHADATASLLLDGSHEYTIDLTTGAAVAVSGS